MMKTIYIFIFCVFSSQWVSVSAAQAVPVAINTFTCTVKAICGREQRADLNGGTGTRNNTEETTVTNLANSGVNQK